MLILCGYAGAGKTTLACAYEEEFGDLVFDTDAALTFAYQKTIREIHAQLGEENFRKAEGDILQQVPSHTQILATGGGILNSEANGIHLQKMGHLLWLATDPALLWERLQARPHPPAFLPEPTHEAFLAHYRTRCLLYERWCEKKLAAPTVHDLHALLHH
jgi:shikimate kinase